MPHAKRLLARDSASRQVAAQMIAMSAADIRVEHGWLAGLLTFLRRQQV